MIGSERHLTYDRPPLSKDVLLGKKTLVALTSDEKRQALGVQLMLGTPGSAPDTERRTVRVGTQDVPARVLDVHGRLPGVHVLRELDDADRLQADLADAQRLVVIGAGFIVAEVAASARSKGIDVTALQAAPMPLGFLGEQFASPYLHDRRRRLSPTAPPR